MASASTDNPSLDKRRRCGPEKRPLSSSSRASGQPTRKAPKFQISKHTSCEGCRQHKTKCDKTSNCSSCRGRGDICVWTTATPSVLKSSGPAQEFPEASTRAQREIARLRALVDALAERAGVSPDDPIWCTPANLCVSVTPSPTGPGSTGGASSDDTTSYDSGSEHPSTPASSLAGESHSYGGNSPAACIKIENDDVELFSSCLMEVAPPVCDNSVLKPSFAQLRGTLRPTILTNTHCSSNMEIGESPDAFSPSQPTPSPSITPSTWKCNPYEQTEESIQAMETLWPSAGLSPQSTELAYDWSYS